MEPLDLVQVGFRAHPDMPDNVRVAFEQATLRVPLEQTGLGIVKAAVSRAPALATADPHSGQLGASASWLQRFEARQSLAVPVEDERGVRGVLAISTARPLVPDGEEWRLLLDQAAMLAAWL